MSGRIREPGEIVHKVTEDALADSGFVLSVETALTTVDGNVKKATATYYEVYGVNYKSTEDYNNPGTFKSGVEVAILKEGLVDVQVAAHAGRTTAIAIGDFVAVLDAGKVAHITDCPITTLLGTVNAANLHKMLKAIVGQAEEALSASADPADGSGKIQVKLFPH